jgi:hypothetical protein
MHRAYMFVIDIPFKGCQGRSNRSSIVHAVSYFACGVNDTECTYACGAIDIACIKGISIKNIYDPELSYLTTKKNVNF